MSNPSRLPAKHLLGGNHQLGPDELVKLLLGQAAKLERRLLESQTLLVRVLGDPAGLVVADLAVEAGDQHERLAHELVDALTVGLDADNAVLLERAHAISEETDGVKEVLDQNGLEDVELEMTGSTGDGDGAVVAHDLGADHGEGLALGGVDLAGHDGRAYESLSTKLQLDVEAITYQARSQAS